VVYAFCGIPHADAGLVSAPFRDLTLDLLTAHAWFCWFVSGAGFQHRPRCPARCLPRTPSPLRFAPRRAVPNSRFSPTFTHPGPFWFPVCRTHARGRGFTRCYFPLLWFYVHCLITQYARFYYAVPAASGLPFLLYYLVPFGTPDCRPFWFRFTCPGFSSVLPGMPVALPSAGHQFWFFSTAHIAWLPRRRRLPRRFLRGLVPFPTPI